jgi:short-subunit dehydrogenase
VFDAKVSECDKGNGKEKEMKKYEGYALITGGSSGFGLEFAHQLAAQGYDLVLVARNQSLLEAAAVDLKAKHHIAVHVIAQDLIHPDAAELIFDNLQRQGIQVGLLVNNAGYVEIGPFMALDRKKTLDLINLMCVGYTDLVYKFLPGMSAAGGGGVILLSSLAALVPCPYFAVYGAAKAYVLQLGISLHAEYKEQGIDFLTVCPGVVATHLYEAAGVPIPDSDISLTAEEVVRKSLAVLGKKIVISMITNSKVKMLLPFKSLLSNEFIEKLVLKEINKALKK